jgi:diguanylate cyclase (GGDEF)-like protein/PAS domain S-box-containing protein
MELEHYEKFFDLAYDPMCIAGIDGFFKKVNPAFVNVTGYSAVELLSSPFTSFIHPDDLQSTNDEVKKQLAGGVTMDYENRYISKDGHIVWLSWHSVYDPESQSLYASARDITERKHSAAQIARTQMMMERTERVGRTGSWEWDVATDTVTWSAETYRFFGRDPALGVPNLEGQRELYTPEDTLFLHETVEKALANGQPYDIELTGVRPNGEKRYCHIRGFPERDETGKIVRLAGSLQDITERKKAEELIWRQANFDELTQLPNRRMFHDRLQQEIRKSHRAQQKLALLFIDLDNFKEVNDTLGHPMGDAMLVEAATRLSGCIRESDTVARLGGDEFIVVLTEIGDVSSVETVASVILSVLLEPFYLADSSMVVSASIGIALYPTDADSGDELLRCADQAMYVAKKMGRNRYHYFKPALQEAALHRSRLISDLRRALVEQQFRVYFQPIIDLCDGKLQKVEALVRWQHPGRGLVSPAEFIGLAEETGLIHDISDWVFHESVRIALRWRDEYGCAIPISVNKSPVQFSRHGGNDPWLDYLRDMGLSGRQFMIEITESFLLHNEMPIMDIFNAYRDSGVQVAIDDFGTGYSSLSYLNKFDIDFLKIDQSFVHNLAPDSADLALVEAIVMMAHKLGLRVIAEGVETEDQRQLLMACGCDSAQGFLFARPMPAEEIESTFLVRPLP